MMELKQRATGFISNKPALYDTALSSQIGVVRTEIWKKGSDMSHHPSDPLWANSMLDTFFTYQQALMDSVQ